MIADPHRLPAPYAPGTRGSRRQAAHGAVEALDRLVLRELEQVAARGTRTPAAARDDADDADAEPAGAERESVPADTVQPPVTAPALDASAARFVERAVAWLARRDDAPAVMEALARAVAAPAATPVESGAGEADAPPA